MITEDRYYQNFINSKTNITDLRKQTTIDFSYYRGFSAEGHLN